MKKVEDIKLIRTQVKTYTYLSGKNVFFDGERKIGFKDKDFEKIKEAEKSGEIAVVVKPVLFGK